MENKKIYIDDVDVSWCEHYTGNIGYLTDKNWTCRAKIQGTKCEDWSNCYFKRWQRKEQECERLSEHHYELEEKFLELNCKSYGYILENDKLKQTLTEIKEIAEEIENYDLYVTVPVYARMGDKIKINLIGIQGILDIISEVEDA